MTLRHVGAGMGIVPELLMRQVLLEGLVELAGDEYRQDELLGRVDSMLQGSQDDWLREFKAALSRMSDVSAPDGIRVGVGYPDMDGRMPYVSIVTEQGSEDESQATLGDLLSRDTAEIGTLPEAGSPIEDFDPESAGRIEARTAIGGEWQSTLQVGSWTEAPEESMLLHAVVKHLLFRHKAPLFAAGVREISMTESGFEPSPVMVQRTGYVPVIRATLHWAWRQTRRSFRPYTFRVHPPSKTNDPL